MFSSQAELGNLLNVTIAECCCTLTSLNFNLLVGFIISMKATLS